MLQMQIQMLRLEIDLSMLTEVAGEGGPDLAPQKFFKIFFASHEVAILLGQ